MLSIAIDSPMPAPKPKSKHGMLPILVVLFLISYGLLSLLVVEQDRTITAQRSLINQIMGDSLELNSLKGKIVMQQHAGAHGKASSQITPQQNKGSVKSRKLVPLKPPVDAVDAPDIRRTPVSL